MYAVCCRETHPGHGDQQFTLTHNNDNIYDNNANISQADVIK